MSIEKLMPLQLHPERNRTRGSAPRAVYMRAYEVYSHIHGEQKALVEGECRGGFGVGEMIAFLYAASFPKAEWSARAQEAFEGLQI